MKIDHRGLQALDAVIQTQSFAAAARQLFITQPAVSLRIKQLEIEMGQPLLVRTLPYHPTPLGEKLLGLLHRMQLLESHVLQEINPDIPTRLSIALNRDSLETWFSSLIAELRLLETISLDIITDDQELTIDYFRQGTVSTCVGSYEKSLPGCECVALGHMDYLLVASPSFIRRFFSNNKPLKDNIRKAPLLVFDSRDRLHEQYFNHFFNTTWTPDRHHMVPSVSAFKEFAIQGYGFGLIPGIDIHDELAAGLVAEICPGKRWLQPLYWHYWQLPAPPYQRFITQIREGAKRYLI
ncbi:ArgP/LysG family DNA-binding transcriptional regulator [Legionella spiritensis]|uniref:ArgP/LysG family DNA-binding transcriptional regulator n=1 Tax=Legionella spiritensis TaxID=452 RepID=UPI000F70EF0B|nr:ArgP/LysG family DNA-binding transcriptional regulator [Legionella spiritensis]VEG91624.1 LysR family transcriptional regulator [Legionella spiritensis]